MLKGIIGGVIGGLLGAALWAGVTYYTDREFGWIAWIVGALVGALTGAFARDEASPMTGAAAALIALVSIAVGKFAVIHIYATKASEKIHSAYRVTDEIAVQAIADQVVEEWEKNSKPVNWPEGMSKDEAAEEKDYPKEIWSDAQGRWTAMSASQQQTYKQDLEAHHHEKMDEVIAAMEAEAFKKSFDLLDIIFALLAIASAYKLGTGDLGGGED
ncbi:MAG TPA: hypothetical protein VF777_02815 [Phycisphaerales bacterium]